MSNCNGHRWSKFWWRDYQGDAALRACSLAARGYWMELLCIAHEATPIGHVLLNGKQPTYRQFAAIAGCSEREARKLEAELKEAGVFSNLENGTIFCRRMVRDAEISEAGRSHIAKRWNGSKVSPDPNSPPTTQPISEPNSQAYRDPNTKKIEAEERKKEPPSVDADASLADVRSVVWSEGLATLIRITGLPPAKARGRLGQLLRNANDDCPGLLRVLRECPHTGDPQAWLSRAAQALAKPRERPSKLAWMRPEPGPFTIDADNGIPFGMTGFLLQ